MLCPSCEAANPEGKNYCGDCGSLLKDDHTLLVEKVRAEIKVRIDEALKERFQDKRVVEVEITESVIKKIQEWAKLLAFLVAVPLAVLIVALSVLGIGSYKDFKQSIVDVSAKVNASIQKSKGEADIIASQVEDLKGRTAFIQKQADDISALKNNVASLSDNVNDITGTSSRIQALKAENKAFGPDIYRASSVDWSKVGGSDVSFIFIKATQGINFVDSAFAGNWEQAKAVGLVRGAYHFGVEGDPIGQADHFVSIVKPSRGDLMALDFEPSPNGHSMSITEAKDFVERIYQKTGRYPMIYGGHSLREALSSPNAAVADLRKCPLWIAQYSASAPRVPAPWTHWTFWQVSNSAPVEGIGVTNVNFFNGTKAELWSFAQNQ